MNAIEGNYSLGTVELSSTVPATNSGRMKYPPLDLKIAARMMALASNRSDLSVADYPYPGSDAREFFDHYMPGLE